VVLNSPSVVNKLPLAICLPFGSVTVNCKLSKGITSVVSPVSEINSPEKYSDSSV